MENASSQKQVGDITGWIESIAREINTANVIAGNVEEMTVRLGYEPKPEKQSENTSDGKTNKKPSVVEKLRICHQRLNMVNERMQSTLDVLNALI